MQVREFFSFMFLPVHMFIFFLKPTLDIKYVVLWTLHVGLTTIVVGLQNTMIVDQTTVTVMFPIEIKLLSLAWCR
jgi:hypothetical protein